MGFFEDVAARIPGLVRTIFRNISDDEHNEIVQIVSTKLVNRLSTPFLWKVIYHTGIDILRLPRSEPLPADQPTVNVSGAEEQRPPFAVLKERLRLVYDDPDTKHHEALAFGYHVHLKYSAEDIALNLAAVPFEDLAKSLVDRIATAADLPSAQIRMCFSRILSICGTPDGMTTFQDHWKPELTVEKWIEDIKEAVGFAVPPPSGVPDLSYAIPKPPNRRIAFCLGSELGLGYRSAEIVGSFGHLTLQEIQTDFEARYRALAPSRAVPLTEWKRLMPVEDGGVGGQKGKNSAPSRQLMSYYTPKRAVAQWVEATKRKLDSEELKQEQLGLKALFDFTRYTAEESMVALFTSTSFLFHPAMNFIIANKVLQDVEKEIEIEYAAKWNFEREAVARWFKPLREELCRTGKGSTTVVHYFPNPESVNKARQKVLDILGRTFAGGGRQPLFAWRHRLL